LAYAIHLDLKPIEIQLRTHDTFAEWPISWLRFLPKQNQRRQGLFDPGSFTPLMLWRWFCVVPSQDPLFYFF
jgi:hypothetical protein